MDLVDRFIHKYGRLPTEFDPDYLEMLRMTKYKVVPFPHYKPSKCANCGSSKVDDRKYVDFGLEIEWYGIVYFCTICLSDIARNVGLFASYQETHFELENRVAELTLQLTELKEQMDREENLPNNLIKAWEEIKVYYDRVHPSESDSSVIDISDPTDIPVVQESNATESDKSGTNATKSRAAKSTSGTRSKDVRSLADLLNSSSE